MRHPLFVAIATEGREMGDGNSFEREVLDRLIKIESKIETWDTSKKQVYENKDDITKIQSRVEQNEKDLEDLKERNKWLSRTIISACITAGIGFVVIFIKMGMGV